MKDYSLYLNSIDSSIRDLESSIDGAGNTIDDAIDNLASDVRDLSIILESFIDAIKELKRDNRP